MPAKGPLFPARPAIKRETIGLFGYFWGELDGLADVTTIVQNQTDLVVSYRGGVPNFNGSEPYVLRIRKNSEDLVAFSYLEDGTPQRQLYGYCYRDSNK